ncbi:MAG: 3-phosphoshikimate 1-carboxyvinyltransferase, partial [Eubacterium sp.]
MSIVKISSCALDGEVVIPPSKSAAHRALICSFLAGGGTVKPIIDSNDMKATVGVLDALKQGKETLDCIESGSTL